MNQSTFARALLGPGLPVPDGWGTRQGSDATARLNVYRNNVVFTLMQALRDTFPVLAALVGPAQFDHWALDFVHAQPPLQPVLTFYGEGFPDALNQHVSAEQAHLADVARLEFARIRAGHLHKTRQRQIERPRATRQAGHARGGDGHAVIGEKPREDFRAPRLTAEFPVAADDFEGGLIGLGAGVAENGVLDPLRREAGEALGEADGGFGGAVEKRGIERELPHLRAHGVDDLGAAVTHVHAPQTGEAIEELAAARVLHENAGAGDDDVRALRVHGVVVREGVEVKALIERLERSRGACHARNEP